MRWMLRAMRVLSHQRSAATPPLSVALDSDVSNNLKMADKNIFTAAEESPRVQSILMTAVRVLRTVLTIGIPVVLVRVLDQSTFGAYKQIGLISMVALGVLGLGLPASLFYFVPRLSERSQTFVVQTAVVFVATSAVGGVVLAFSTETLAR